ncbi:MAG: M20/M25/M40 family metallo-hydrolase [Anaerolineae bacterium]
MGAGHAVARRYPVDVVAVWSVQEETGLRGAAIAAHRLRPSAAFVLECGTTDDTPKERDDTPVMRVGDGPAITVVDAGMVADARLVEHLVRSADRAGVRHQIRAPKGGGTDGGRIHLARAGVPTAVVSAPCRYLHGPQALVSKDDLAGVVALMRQALGSWPPAPHSWKGWTDEPVD